MPPATLLAAAGWLEAGAPGRRKTGRTRMPLDIAAADAILADNFAAWVMATGIKAEAAGTDTATLRIPSPISSAAWAASCAGRRC
jgi:hypothetical protein